MREIDSDEAKNADATTDPFDCLCMVCKTGACSLGAVTLTAVNAFGNVQDSGIFAHSDNAITAGWLIWLRR